jgi:hypothetical protein
MRRTVLPALALAFALAACGSNDGGGGDSASVASETPEECIGYGCSPEQDAELNEGEAAANGQASSVADSGGNLVTFPDGLEVTIVSLEVADPSVFSQQEDNEQPLVLTTRWANTGDAEIPFAGYDTVSAQLLSGPNGFEVDHYAVGGPDTELPARLVPGSGFDYKVFYSVPDASVLELSFSPDPDTYPAATFTEVETLLG